MTEAGAAPRSASCQWGVALLPDGSARFRLWAPRLETLTLRLEGRDLDMERSQDGWFERRVDGVRAGAAYGFVLPDGLFVPDAAARAQAGDVHGPSIVADPDSYAWQHPDWPGRPWREAVISEIHIGTFTPEGSFRAAAERLPLLAEAGITAIELMPVAQFSGNRGWGYDGVLPYAPHSAYGTPDDLRHLVDVAHGLGLMVLLDVVYNHFGPDGNYLPAFAPDFFDAARHTPWGPAIAYERLPVRRYFIENALYWLTEFRFDGLRLDAVDQIRDTSTPELLVEIAEAVRRTLPGREIHLTTEDNRNITRLHERERNGGVPLYTAEWNDDFHNAAHVVLTGETEGYYEDFADDPLALFARCLAAGFAYQGELSRHAGHPRGEPSAHLPPLAFVDFLQNHDQIGNRALGERLTTLVPAARLEALTAILLLSPHVPLLFMGDEWGETRPFCFFTDFHGDLANAVREGRRKEFAHFAAFDTAAERSAIPDPNAQPTFDASKVDWSTRESENGRARLDLVKRLIAIRQSRIVPLLDDQLRDCGRVLAAASGALAVNRTLSGATLQLRAALCDGGGALPPIEGEAIYASSGTPTPRGVPLALGPWSVVVSLS